MARGRGSPNAPGAALPWLAVGLVVVVVCWFGLSSGVVDRVRSAGAPVIVRADPPQPSPAPAGRPDFPTPGGGEAAAPIGSPPKVGRGRGSYKFMAEQADGIRPVAYDPCRQIHFVVRSKGAPAGGRKVILEAIGEISSATGLQFVDDGSTSEAPANRRKAYQPRRYGDTWAPVLIAWQTPKENPDFATDVAGEAGSVPVEVQGRDTVYVTGQVQLDATKIGDWLRQGGQAAARTLILHELGHLVGLDHVKDASQVMFPRVSPDVPNLGHGDRLGLAALGRGECAPYL